MAQGRIGAMLEQQLDRGKIVEVERVVKRVAAADASAILQKQPGAGETLQRVVERFVVIGIGARFEQDLRQLEIVILSRRAIERRQWVIVVRRAHGRRRPTQADPLVGIGAGREQKSRASMQAFTKLRHLAQA
jgi:hypothetical protein